MRGKAFGGLLFFFAIPIAMIGYPSIQKITFQDGVVTIDKTADQALTSIAKAQFALGRRAEANTSLESALRKAPALPAAVELKQRIETEKAPTAKNNAKNNAKNKATR
jgi:hypothetical protein